MKNVSLILLLIYLFTGGMYSPLYADIKEKPKKVQETKAMKTAPPKDDTEDHIRCDEETYKKYLELRPKYIEIQRQIGEIDAKLKANEKNLDTLKGMSDEEIDREVREENVKNIEEENSTLRTNRKKMEEEGIEFYKIFEPIRHKCED